MGRPAQGIGGAAAVIPTVMMRPHPARYGRHRDARRIPGAREIDGDEAAQCFWHDLVDPD
jgi:hypothetical protein